MIANYDIYNDLQPQVNQFNSVIITGSLASIKESHIYRGEKYYESYIFCERESRVLDFIPIIISETVLHESTFDTKKRVEIIGEIRTFYLDRKLKLYVHVFSLNMASSSENDTNIIRIEGRICKRPTYRVTPLGREISDLCVAVKRPYGKIDFIPCITWGLAARRSSKYEIDDIVSISGRFQSREYEKDEHSCRVFEISVRDIKKEPAELSDKL